MVRFSILFLVFFISNAMSTECEDLLANYSLEKIFNVCYSEAGFTTETDQGEITSLNNGTVESQYILGFLFEMGYAVERNDWAAIHWYTKAADRGYAKAQYRLGNLYNTPDSPFNVPWDLGLAQYYLGLACKNGISEACPDYESLRAL